MEPDPIYELVGEAMQETPEHRLGMAINGAFSSLDEIMAMAAYPNTKHLVIAERRALHQLVSRAQLIASFVDASLDQPGKVRLVVNRA